MSFTKLLMLRDAGILHFIFGSSCQVQGEHSGKCTDSSLVNLNTIALQV